MKALGYLFLAAGFLVGAYATALDIQQTDWMLFTPAFIFAVVGVFIMKRESRGEARSEAVLSSNKAALQESLQSVVSGLDQLIAEHAESHRDLPAEIDERFRHELRRFADARESIVHLYGLQAYADIMSEFAAGERYLNRVWSAAADGYHEEAATYLAKAEKQFADALAKLQSTYANAA